MTIFTLGFAQKSAEEFFTGLKKAGVRRLVDVRLNNVSQLAGFTKKRDLGYFLQSIAGIEYVHEPSLAPTQAILDEFKKAGGAWQIYERKFVGLLQDREVERRLTRHDFESACLLCSEPTAERCHRRLVAEYLRDCWGDVDIVHL